MTYPDFCVSASINQYFIPVQINVDEEGTVTIYGKSQKAAYDARDAVLSLVEEPEVGKIYSGKIKRIMNFGAFCEILPGKEGLIHVSELADKFVKNVEDVVKIGDEVTVKVIEIDEQGRVNLSKKQAKDLEADKDRPKS